MISALIRVRDTGAYSGAQKQNLRVHKYDDFLKNLSRTNGMRKNMRFAIKTLNIKALI